MGFNKQYYKGFFSSVDRHMDWAVKVFTLGRFSLVINGEPLEFKGKAQHKTLKLLKALIVLGGRDVSKYQLTDILYPDGEGDKSLRAMVTTLHRLRKLLGNKDIIHLKDHKLTLDSKYCWVDVWLLERLLGRIDKDFAQFHANDGEILSLTNNIMHLYKGDFLNEEIDGTWVLPYREDLRNKFLRKLSLIGDYWEQSEHLDIAVDIYLRILEKNKVAEEFYQRLMICYQKQGFRGEAISVYERCVRNLNSALGIEPSTRTKTIHDNLK